MMKITGLSHLFKWENLHNWWLTKYFFAPLYVIIHHQSVICWVGRLRFTFLSWSRDINSWEHDIMSWPRDVILRE